MKKNKVEPKKNKKVVIIMFKNFYILDIENLTLTLKNFKKNPRIFKIFNFK